MYTNEHLHDVFQGNQVPDVLLKEIRDVRVTL